MIKIYEALYNDKESDISVDKSWARYSNGKDADARYTYSVSKLSGSVLDVGSGDGYGAFLMLKSLAIKSVTGLEIQDEAIRQFNENLSNRIEASVVKGIAEKMPFDNNSFDTVHCGQTLEHVLNAEAVLKEVARVMRTKAVLSVPILGGINKQHLREYKTEQEFIDTLEPYFTVVSKETFTCERGHKRIVVEVVK